MRPLALLDRDEARGLVALATDLDDTVLDHGALAKDTYAALCDLAASGLPIVVATGRPLGWAEVVARTWPVAAALAENGAAAAVNEGGRTVRITRDPSEPGRLAALRDEIQAAFPDLRTTDDARLRETDVTFDVGEYTKVAPDVVLAVTGFARARGAVVSVSSVHLHVSFSPSDKASGIVWMARRLFGLDETRARRCVAFAGDSGNDAAAFAGFRTTFGVANVAPHLRTLTLAPRYVSAASRGAGFAEICRALLGARA